MNFQIPLQLKVKFYGLVATNVMASRSVRAEVVRKFTGSTAIGI